MNQLSLKDTANKSKKKIFICNMNKQNFLEIKSFNGAELSINQLIVLFFFKITLT